MVHAEAGERARASMRMRARGTSEATGPRRHRQRHHDVLGDAERRAERQLLVDHDDAGARGCRAARRNAAAGRRGAPRRRRAAGRRPGCSSASTCRRRSRRSRHGPRRRRKPTAMRSSASTPGKRLVTPAILRASWAIEESCSWRLILGAPRRPVRPPPNLPRGAHFLRDFGDIVLGVEP